jgi:hypothetical protein
MTEFLDDLLSKEHRIRRDEIRRLDRRQLRELVDVARGSRDPEHQVRALGVLATFQGEQALRVLSEVALDRDQDAPVRAAAVAQLGRTSESAATHLMRVMESEDDRTVLTAALGSVARVGAPDTVDALAAVARRAPDIAAQAAFAATVVAFRHRMRGYEPSFEQYRDLVPAPSDDGGAPVHAHALRADEAADALVDLRADGYSTRLDAGATLGVRCQRDRLVVALDASLTTAGEHLAEFLREGPVLAGVVGLRSPVDPGYAVRWLLLTWADGHEQHVAVHRPGGPAALYGTATIEGDRASFALTTVRAPGATPAQVRGELAAGRLALEGTAAVTRLTPRQPTALT